MVILVSNYLRAQNEFVMSNDNVHLMIEKRDTLQENINKLLVQFTLSRLTKLELVLDAVNQLRHETDGKLKRTSVKLDEVIECTRLKVQKPIALKRVGQGGARKSLERKSLKRKAKDEAKRRLKI